MEANTAAAPDEFEVAINRRVSRRYPIRQDVRYRLLDGEVAGAGSTTDISSNGVLFTTERSLPTGRVVEISVNWPARLDANCGLKLVASGRVVRSDGRQAAIRFGKYEFRTRYISEK